MFFAILGEPPSNDKPVGPYPYVVTRSSGTKAYVVQDFAFGKYLGYLNVTFNSQGVVTSATGNPILLDNSTLQGALLLGLVTKFKRCLFSPLKETILDLNYTL